MRGLFSYCSISLLKTITKKSINGIIPKHPPKVAAYTIGTHGFVPSITRCAPINPKGNGNADTAHKNFFFRSLFFIDAVNLPVESFWNAETETTTVSAFVINSILFSAEADAFVTTLADTINRRDTKDEINSFINRNKKGDV